MPGVTIGDGAIIGTRAVVTKDVAPYEIVGGNPAQVLRKRFDDETIDFLLQLQWWNWPIEQIREHVLAIMNGELKKREPIFHREEFGRSRSDFENMMDADFWEVGASGAIYSKEYVG